MCCIELSVIFLTFFMEHRTWALPFLLFFFSLFFFLFFPWVVRIYLSGCHSKPNDLFSELRKLIYVWAGVRIVAILHISLNLPLMNIGKLFCDEWLAFLYPVQMFAVQQRRYSESYTVRVGVRCSLNSSRRCLFLCLYCPKGNFTWRKMVLLFWENFLNLKIQYCGRGGRKKKTKQMKYFLAWQFCYFTEIGIQIFASGSNC